VGVERGLGFGRSCSLALICDHHTSTYHSTHSFIHTYIHATFDSLIPEIRRTKKRKELGRQRMTVTVSRCLVSAKRLILSYGHGGTQAPPAPPSRAPRTTAGNYRPFRLARSSIPTELGLEPDLPLTRLPVHTEGGNQSCPPGTVPRYIPCKSITSSLF
jgi:hypothetical protein